VRFPPVISCTPPAILLLQNWFILFIVISLFLLRQQSKKRYLSEIKIKLHRNRTLHQLENIRLFINDPVDLLPF